MPPSGFSQKAINGLLEFLRANYKTIADQYVGTNLSEQEFLEETSNELENQVKTALIERLPNSKHLNEGIQGLATFVAECYMDLAREIRAGKDRCQRPVIDGKAIQKELRQIGDYLGKFEI